jgi:hypothetical protein
MRFCIDSGYQLIHSRNIRDIVVIFDGRSEGSGLVELCECVCERKRERDV